MRHYAASVGIPSGLSFAGFDAFGIYTRRTGRGRHDVTDWCTRTAICALAPGVKATSPSIPAVRRPVLRWVTCRTLTSVLARLRSNTGRPAARCLPEAGPFPPTPGPNHAGTFQCTWLSSGYTATAVRVPAWMAW